VLRQVKAIELKTRRLVSTLFSGEYRSVFRGQGIEFAEVRAYEQGDDYRSIDWNVSARMGSPYVKTFVEERELAAVLALAAARQNDRVGAVIFSSGVDHVVPPAKGRGHALRVLRDLIAFRPTERGTNIGAALGYSARLLRHRAVVVIISDFRAADWEQPLRRLSRRHEVVAITVDDPRELELPDAGWVELNDAESGGALLVDTSHAPTRVRLRIAAEQARLQRARVFSQTQVDHIALRTDQPYAQALHRTFALRARRLRR
jgi:uncharacterized protein (DUF58 family)